MTKKTYVFYSIALFICAFWGAVIVPELIFLNLNDASFIAVLLCDLLSSLIVSLVAFITFLFSRNVMVNVRNRWKYFIFWELAIFILSPVGVCVSGGGINVLAIIFALAIWFMPTLIVWGVTAILYSKKINITERLKSISTIKQTIIETVLICFIPVLIFFVTDMISSLFGIGPVHSLLGGIQNMITSLAILLVVPYIINRTKETRGFARCGMFFYFVFYVLTAGILYSLTFIFETFLKESFLYDLLGTIFFCSYFTKAPVLYPVIMMILPPLAFAITSLITLAVRRGKKAEDSSAA